MSIHPFLCAAGRVVSQSGMLFVQLSSLKTQDGRSDIVWRQKPLYNPDRKRGLCNERKNKDEFGN